MDNEKKYEAFIEKDKMAELGGGLDKLQKQRESGKMTARERIEVLILVWIRPKFLGMVLFLDMVR